MTRLDKSLLWLGRAAAVVVLIIVLSLGCAGTLELVSGDRDDEKCRQLATEVGGQAESLNSLFDCRVVLPSGTFIHGSDIEEP